MPQAFDPETFADTECNEASDSVGLDKVENAVRWRYDPTQVPHLTKPGLKDSNAQLVRWSDDSFSLLVGEELFDVATSSLDSRHAYLLSQHGQEACFRNQCRLQNLMTFRPSSTQSLTHKKLTLAIATKHTKSSRAKMYSLLENPENVAKEAAKAEQERLKAKRRLESKQRAVRERELDGGLEEYDDEVYMRGNDNLMREFDNYDEQDDFSRFLLTKLCRTRKSPTPKQSWSVKRV